MILGFFKSLPPAETEAGPPPLPPPLPETGGPSLVTSLRGGRFPLIFCGAKLGLFCGITGFVVDLGSTFGRVKGRYVDVDWALFVFMGLPIPPGAPSFRFISEEGLMKSRVGLEAGEEVPASMGFEMGTVLVWSKPAVLRIEGLSACGSNCGAEVEPACGLSRSMSTARAEKKPAPDVGSPG